MTTPEIADPPAQRYCRDCAFCRPDAARHSAAEQAARAWCAAHGADPVTGEPRVRCAEARQVATLCGPGGRWWRQRPGAAEDAFQPTLLRRQA